MARIPAGVVVVSARHGAGYRGLTASSLVSISARAAIGAGRPRARGDHAGGRRGGAGLQRQRPDPLQEFIADRFAGRAPAIDTSGGQISHQAWGPTAYLLSRDALPGWNAAWWQSHPAGDHDICIGRVEAAMQGAGDPLILWDRAFWTLR